RAFDAGGTQTHEGSVTMNVVAGTNPIVSLVLTPLTGELSITATLGTIIVTVTPSPASVGRGLTIPLVATITGALPGPVSWATRNPGVAQVTSDLEGHGVVTGVAA